MIYSRLRQEEKLIFQALEKRGIEFERIDVRRLGLGFNDRDFIEYDLVLLRCLSHSRTLYLAKMLEERGVKTLNSYATIAVCGDKILTSIALREHGIPTPHGSVAFSPKTALAAIEEMGYPAVMKPPVGSWGRLIAKVNDRESAEAIIEHKQIKALTGSTVFYIQDYIDKPGRDIRTLVVGDETVYAIYRRSSHWITNTARGGMSQVCSLTSEIDRLSRAAAAAVGGGVVAVDILETSKGHLLVNEVNHTPEFHGACEVTGLDIAGKIIEYMLSEYLPAGVGFRGRKG